METVQVKRGQVIAKEGDFANKMWVIKNGSFRLDRNIYIQKKKNDLERQMLVQDTTTTKRFTQNFVGNLGVKRDFNIKLANIETGRSFGCSELIKGSLYGASMTCESNVG